MEASGGGGGACMVDGSEIVCLSLSRERRLGGFGGGILGREVGRCGGEAEMGLVRG